MRIAILSDIHGNLDALEAALDETVRLGAELVYSLGDVVGYGPEPGACLALVRSRVSINLLGNHDAAVAGVTPIEDFNAFARQAVLWTRSELAPAEEGFHGLRLFACFTDERPAAGCLRAIP